MLLEIHIKYLKKIVMYDILEYLPNAVRVLLGHDVPESGVLPSTQQDLPLGFRGDRGKGVKRTRRRKDQQPGQDPDPDPDDDDGGYDHEVQIVPDVSGEVIDESEERNPIQIIDDDYDEDLKMTSEPLRVRFDPNPVQIPPSPLDTPLPQIKQSRYNLRPRKK